MEFKRVFALFLFLLFISLAVAQTSKALITGEVITGEVITGRATSQSLSFGIVVVSIPVVNIQSPQNKTYISVTLPLTYTISGNNLSSQVYAINSGANTTLSGTPLLTFNNNSLNRLDVWANNTDGTGQDFVYLTVDTSLLKIINSNFEGQYRGNSTNLSYLAYTDLQGYSGIVFEDKRYGKITYNGDINITNDSNPTDRVVTINTNIVLLEEEFFVDATDLPNFNKTATLEFYGVDFASPKIQVDGKDCPSTVCQNQSYTNGVFKIDVAFFFDDAYTVIEGSVSLGEGPSGGGGGGSGSGGGTYNLEILVPGVLEIGQNDEVIVSVIVTNKETTIFMKGITMSAKSSNLELLTRFESILPFDLDPGQDKKLTLFITSKDLLPGEYEIEITANVTSPRFTKTQKAFIRAVELVGKVEVVERIILAQELFRENPECLELNDLLIRAKELVDAGNVDTGKTLVQEAISRCRDLITNREFPSPTNYNTLAAWRTPIEIALGLIVVSLVIFMALRRPKIDLKKRQVKSRRKGLFKRVFAKV